MNRGPAPVPAGLATLAAGQLRLHLQVAKLPLCLLVAFSSLFGFALSARHLGPQAWLVGFSVLVLAAGAASLNSYQEHRCDRLMQRTRRRPVAAGTVAPEQARRQGQVLAGGGLALLYLTTLETAPVVAGAAALVLYNWVYTPLKHRSVWALLPGAACGAIPPYIGWLAGGGAVFSPVILGGVLLLLLWQIPHFWLVLLGNSRDYRRAPLPSLVQRLDERTLRIISIVWIAALVSVVHSLLAVSTALPAAIRIMISAAALLVLLVYSLQMTISRRPAYRFLFIMLNSFMLYTMALFAVGAAVS